MAATSPPNVTLRAIARVAKASVSTVSYALRNDPRLLPATRLRIQAIAQKLGYRPNPVFAAMMARARRGAAGAVTGGEVIAYVSGFATEAQWRRVFPQTQFFLGARARAEAMNFRLEPFFYVEKGWSAERLTQVLVTRGVRGAIIAPFPRALGCDPLHIEWTRFALATIGFTLEAPMLHRVTADHFYNLRLAVAAVHAAGYRRVGCVLPHAISRRIDHQWSAALEMPAKGAPHVQVPPLILETGAWSETALRQWHREQRPDFIITRSDDLPGWVRSKLGRRTPPLAELSLSPTSAIAGGIDEHNRRIGATAVDLVASQLRHNEYGVPDHPTLTLLPGEWRWLKTPPADGKVLG